MVTTTSGLRGTVVDVSYEDTIDLEIADGVGHHLAARRRARAGCSTPPRPTRRPRRSPASDNTVSDTPPSGTPVVAADQPALDGPVGTGARVDAESAPTSRRPARRQRHLPRA